MMLVERPTCGARSFNVSAFTPRFMQVALELLSGAQMRVPLVRSASLAQQIQ